MARVLKRSDEYRRGQAAIAADRFSRSSDQGSFSSRLAWSLRLAATCRPNTGELWEFSLLVCYLLFHWVGALIHFRQINNSNYIIT